MFIMYIASRIPSNRITLKFPLTHYREGFEDMCCRDVDQFIRKFRGLMYPRPCITKVRTDVGDCVSGFWLMIVGPSQHHNIP